MSFARVVVGTLVPRAARDALRSMHNARKKTLSQVGQDSWVFGEAFNGKRDGFFLEIGSGDGLTLNNTYLLEKRYGWQGLCIEPNPESFAKLKRNRSCTCLNTCVDSEEGEVTFVLDGVSGGILAPDTDNKPGPAASHEVLCMKTRRLDDILREHDAPRVIDYVSLDVEGAEERVLRAFPFSEYRFDCLTVERPSALLRQILSENGYLLLKDIPGLDCFYVHSLFWEEYSKNMFAYWSAGARSS